MDYLFIAIIPWFIQTTTTTTSCSSSNNYDPIPGLNRFIKKLLVEP